MQPSRQCDVTDKPHGTQLCVPYKPAEKGEVLILTVYYKSFYAFFWFFRLRCRRKSSNITTAADELPTEDGQSNFGTGYGYQFAADGTVEVEIDGEYVIFAAE